MSAPGLNPKGVAAPLLRWMLWTRRRVLLLAAGLLLTVPLIAHAGAAARNAGHAPRHATGRSPAAAAGAQVSPSPAATTPPTLTTVPPAGSDPPTTLPHAQPTAPDAPTQAPAINTPTVTAVAPGALPRAATPARVAITFATRWVNHGIDPVRWLAGLQPLCTDEYGKVVLPTVDPGTVPASHITGAARTSRTNPRVAQVVIPLNGVTIRVTVVDVTGTGHWLVDNVNPAGQ
jgi:hypothetical protein